MKNKKLIMVDDDEIFIYLTKKAIDSVNIVDLIKVFGNGLDAIDFLKAHAHKPEELPEIIFLDLSMPIMDGWQFLEEYILLGLKVSGSSSTGALGALGALGAFGARGARGVGA